MVKQHHAAPNLKYLVIKSISVRHGKEDQNGERQKNHSF